MSLSTRNKEFLGFLRNLNINFDQFLDKTFDGLFDNVPEDMNYFFNWFMENITPDNVLTEMEQGLYFELEKSGQLPSEEEMNFYQSSSDISYEELNSLDLNYVKFLAQDLEDLEKTSVDLANISSSLECAYNEIEKKVLSLKGTINTWNKRLDSSKQKCNEVYTLLTKKLEDVKTFLVSEPTPRIDISSYLNVLTREREILNKYSKYDIFEHKLFASNNLAVPLTLEGDLACVEAFSIFSQGSAIEKKVKIELLSDFIDQNSQRKNLQGFCLSLASNKNEEVELDLKEKIISLEKKIKEEAIKFTDLEIKNIVNQCLEKKLDFNKTFTPNLLVCKDYMKMNQFLNLLLSHILTKAVGTLDDSVQLRTKLSSKLFKMETDTRNIIGDFEMRKQRFKAIQANPHPFLKDLQKLTSVEKNVGNNPETVKNLFNLISRASDDSNFISHDFRMKIKLSVKSLLNTVLCGPTSQLLFLPVDLMSTFQLCKRREEELNYALKRLANNFVEAKASISESDRKKLLLWIKFLMGTSDVNKTITNQLQM